MSNLRVIQSKLLGASILVSAILAVPWISRPTMFIILLFLFSIAVRIALAILAPLWIIARLPRITRPWIWASAMPIALVLLAELVRGQKGTMRLLADVSAPISMCLVYAFRMPWLLLVIAALFLLARFELRVFEKSNVEPSTQPESLDGSVPETGQSEDRTQGQEHSKQVTFRPAQVFAISIVVALIAVGLFMAASHFRSASNMSASEAVNQGGATQSQTGAVNPGALRDWEVMKPSSSSEDSAKNGLSHATKKRIRENFALAVAGGFQKMNNPIQVELTGGEHDVLMFTHPELDNTVADAMISEFDTEPTTNFWNGMRLLDYREVVFSGKNFRRVVTRSEFITKSKNFDQYKADFLKAVRNLEAGAEGEALKK